MTPAEMFVAAARKRVGTPWRHRGRMPWGIDCVGLVVLSARDAGMSVKDWVGYGREPWDGTLRRVMHENCGDPLPRADWRAGDIALIRWRKDEASHLGIIADYCYGGLSLIHADNLHGVIEQPLKPPLIDLVEEAYRLWHGKSSR